MARVFDHGGLRLYLLLLLEQPRHGYELIRLVEQRFMGSYTPSAGTVYPRLAALEVEGLIEHDDVDGRKVYRLTDAGRAALAGHRDDIEQRVINAVAAARGLARGVRHDVRLAARELRRVRRSRDALRSLTDELEAFSVDIADRAADIDFDGRLLREVRLRLRETKKDLHGLLDSGGRA